jgi:multiple sugar transport system permease protein
MAHIPQVGRNTPKMRFLLASIYLVLILGGITTVYPFLVMLGSSITSEYDSDQYPVIPKYLFSTSDLYGKFVDDKYNANIQTIDAMYGHEYAKPTDIRRPVHIDLTLVSKWDQYVRSLPQEYKLVGFRGTPGQYAPAPMLDTYRDWLRHKFHNNIHALDHNYLEEDTNFLSVFPPFERPQMRLFVPGMSAKDVDWAAFKLSQPSVYLIPVMFDPVYAEYLKDEVYNEDITQLNKSWNAHYADFSQITLPEKVPGQRGQAMDWATFVRTKLPLRFLVQNAPKNENISELALQNKLPMGVALTALATSIRSANPKTLTVITADTIWRSKNNASSADAAAQSDWLYAEHHQFELRRDFLMRNYLFTLDYLLLHGDGVWNTFIYCSAAVFTALLVNPLCAYALSRFKLPMGQSVLLFLLATMAFPGEVSMIPNFLLLKQFGLLNTFWALILPGAASGYSIFLLKGFFDSLPKELYEAGMIDGASELTLFRRVTLPLSMPIFAVIALGAFSAAYGNFLFAMVLCQAQSHWTIMVWVYEFQALNAPAYVMMSALVVASLPMLIVFLFAQNTIMKGVILPSYK